MRTGFADATRPEALQRQRAIAMEAWRIELVTPRTILESYRVLRVGPREIAQHRDGLSINTPMVRALTALGLFDRSKAPGPDDAATTGQIKDFNAKIDGHAGLLLAGDRGQRSQDPGQRRPGLCARTTGGDGARPVHAAAVAGLAGIPGTGRNPMPRSMPCWTRRQPRFTVQMWARLGYAPAIGPAPRRGLEAHIIKT